MRKLLFTLVLALLVAGGSSLATVASAAPVTYRFWDEATAGLAVSGTYDTVVGNFAGGPTDDIVWRAAGATTDHVWTSNGDATFSKRALPMQAPDGTTALVGQFSGDDREDIFWYGPGSVRDVLWTSTDAGFVAAALNVSGTYRVTVIDDRTGYDAVLFQGTSSTVWDFRGVHGDHRSIPVAPPAGSVAVPGRFDADDCGDVFFYNAGTAADALYDFDCAGGVRRSVAQRVDGTYQPLVAQFSSERDAQDDILWYGGARGSALWENERNGRWTGSIRVLPAAQPIVGSDGAGFVHLWFAGSIGGGEPDTHDVWYDLTGSLSHHGHLTNSPMGPGYQPIVGSFVGAQADILWYQPGPAPERMFFIAR